MFPFKLIWSLDHGSATVLCAVDLYDTSPIHITCEKELILTTEISQRYSIPKHPNSPDLAEKHGVFCGNGDR